MKNTKQNAKNASKSIFIGRDANGAEIKINASEIKSIISQTTKIKWWFYAIVFAIIVAGAIGFWVLAVVSYRYFGFALDANNVVVTLVGILATFVVVGNYLQVQDVKREFGVKVSGVEIKMNALKNDFAEKISDVKGEFAELEQCVKGNLLVENLLDSRNIDMWKYLNSVYNIKVEFGNYKSYDNYESYGVFSKGKSATIYVPKNSLDIPSFTHELLHIFLRVKEICISGHLLLAVRNEPNIKNVLSERLIGHVGNCLEHIKMLPIFVEMGFKENNFIDDYTVNKLSKEDIETLQKNFCVKPLLGSPYFSKIYVDLYIGKYFAAKVCPNRSFDYSDGLNALKSINPELYSILDKFMGAWVDFDINNTDPITGGYHSMVYSFTSELEDWILSNKIQ